MRAIPKLLSKTKLMRGYRCLKCIYLTIHHPNLEAPISDETQALFNQGNQVGTKAREYYPNGILIDNKPWDFTGALSKTNELIHTGSQTIYEAAFEFAGCYARADIIQFSPVTKKWRIFEVKSSTKVKPEHYDDVGLQAWIMAKSGLPIEQINVVHLNPDCRFPNLDNLFCEVDVTDEIRSRYLDIQPTIKEIFSCIQSKSIPDVDIGPYCLEPTECGFKDHCWNEKKIPAFSVFNLPGIKTRKWELYQQGIIQVDDVRLHDLTDIQARIQSCFKNKTRYIDADQIKEAMATWQFPLIFLDFETINPAIPRYQGCRPFEHTPFQFSVHILRHPDAEIEHRYFLHEDLSDPRPKLIPALLDACETNGSIVAYYGRFESERIQSLAAFDQDKQHELLALVTRIVDPLPIIREHVYDNQFAGSFSLKAVAPALLGEAQSYAGMDVADGGAAQRAFEELIAVNTSPTKKNALKNALLSYCEKDTLVMVELAKWLYAV